MDNLPPLRDVLRQHNLTAKKSFGQHFLLDLNLTDKIARLCAPHPVVIEIGPGPGGLTRSLLAADTNHLITIEKDDRFLPILADIKAQSPERLTIINDDALQVDIGGLSDIRPLRICANLPYNVGTKLLINWLTATPVFWDRMVLMLQYEVAQRISAQPYGRLAVLAQSVASAHIALRVPAAAFTPPPKVDSAVIVFDILPVQDRFSDLKTLGQITAAAFGQRRKMLRKSLQMLAKDWDISLAQWLELASIDPSIRPETLDVEGFHKLVKTAKSLSIRLGSTV